MSSPSPSAGSRFTRAASAIALGAALALGAGAAGAQPASWATSQAEELTRQGEDHARHGDPATAIRRFLDAVAFDPTYGPAYLALGAAHESAGDPHEAERAYSMGLEHVNGFAAGRLARGRLFARQHRFEEAIADLREAEALQPDDIPTLQQLSRDYLALRSLPAALAIARRIGVLAGAQKDVKAAAAARADIRALGALVGELDPVAAGLTGRGPARRALALLALRKEPGVGASGRGHGSGGVH